MNVPSSLETLIKLSNPGMNIISLVWFGEFAHASYAEACLRFYRLYQLDTNYIEFNKASFIEKRKVFLCIQTVKPKPSCVSRHIFCEDHGVGFSRHTYHLNQLCDSVKEKSVVYYPSLQAHRHRTTLLLPSLKGNLAS
jgi:hypothetical protein